jgi:hypothetical protein
MLPQKVRNSLARLGQLVYGSLDVIAPFGGRLVFEQRFDTDLQGSGIPAWR